MAGLTGDKRSCHKGSPKIAGVPVVYVVVGADGGAMCHGEGSSKLMELKRMKETRLMGEPQ